MKIAITPPVISRALTIANVDAILPRIDSPTIELDSNRINSWYAATVFPDGVNVTTILNDAGNWTVEDASGSAVAGSGDGIGGLHFLQLAVKRRPGYSGAIAAQQIALVCDVTIPVSAVNTTAGNGTLTTGLHGLQVGQAVKVSASALPTGLSGGTDYFVISAGFTPTTVRLSATRGGSAIVPGTTGTAVKLVPGKLELGRVHVAAAGAGTFEPVAVPFLWYSESNHHLWGDQLELQYSNLVESAHLTLEVQAAGEN